MLLYRFRPIVKLLELHIELLELEVIGSQFAVDLSEIVIGVFELGFVFLPHDVELLQ